MESQKTTRSAQPLIPEEKKDETKYDEIDLSPLVPDEQKADARTYEEIEEDYCKSRFRMIEMSSKTKFFCGRTCHFGRHEAAPMWQMPKRRVKYRYQADGSPFLTLKIYEEQHYHSFHDEPLHSFENCTLFCHNVPMDCMIITYQQDHPTIGRAFFPNWSAKKNLENKTQYVGMMDDTTLISLGDTSTESLPEPFKSVRGDDHIITLWPRANRALCVQCDDTHRPVIHGKSPMYPCDKQYEHNYDEKGYIAVQRENGLKIFREGDETTLIDFLKGYHLICHTDLVDALIVVHKDRPQETKLYIVEYEKKLGKPHDGFYEGNFSGFRDNQIALINESMFCPLYYRFFPRKNQ
jgi:hypothetical protein